MQIDTGMVGSRGYHEDRGVRNEQSRCEEIQEIEPEKRESHKVLIDLDKGNQDEVRDGGRRGVAGTIRCKGRLAPHNIQRHVRSLYGPSPDVYVAVVVARRHIEPNFFCHIPEGWRAR